MPIAYPLEERVGISARLMKMIAASLRGALRRYRRFPFHAAIVAAIALVVYAFSAASSRRVEELFAYRLEISGIYERWLIVRTDALNYLKSDKQVNIKAKLESSLERFEDSFVAFSRDRLMRFQRESAEIAERGTDLLRDWQAVEGNLMEILATGVEFETFSRQIYWLVNDTVDFDANLRELLLWFDGYSRRQFALHWRLFFFLVVTAVLCLLLAGRFIHEYILAARDREEARRMLDTAVSGREDERLKLALEIHDTIIQDLSLSRMLCYDLQESRPRSESRQKLESLTRTIVKAIRRIREITLELMPQELDGRDLDAAFSEYCADYGAKVGIEVKVSAVGFKDARMSKAQRLSLFRILQECLSNVYRHAGASRATVRLLLSYPYVIMRVSDDGRGANPELLRNEAFRGSHLGLRGIEERVRMFGGEMNIKTVSGKGFTVGIKMPLRESENEA